MKQERESGLKACLRGASSKDTARQYNDCSLHLKRNAMTLDEMYLY